MNLPKRFSLIAVSLGLMLLLVGATTTEIYFRNLSQTATTPSSDDYAVIDGATNKSRKIRPWLMGNKVTLAMGALEVNTSGRVHNTQTLTAASHTITFSETPPDGTVVPWTITGYSSDCTLTIPSAYSLNAKANITTFVVGASAVEKIMLLRENGAWTIYGEPPKLTITEPAAATVWTPASGSNVTWVGAYTITPTFTANSTPTFPAGTVTLLASGGALGTPSSGTLTNATGLPQSGTVGLTTSDSPQFAGVNVGHTSDTTITRTGAGQIAVEGVKVPMTDIWIIPLGDETTAITTGVKFTFRAPYAATVTAVRASLTTASSSGDPVIDIHDSGTTIMTTNKLVFDANEKTTTTYSGTAAALTDTSLADDAELTIEVDTAGTGAAGAKVAIYVTRT